MKKIILTIILFHFSLGMEKNDCSFEKKNDYSFEKKNDYSFEKKNDYSFEKKNDFSFGDQNDSSSKNNPFSFGFQYDSSDGKSQKKTSYLSKFNKEVIKQITDQINMLTSWYPKEKISDFINDYEERKILFIILDIFKLIKKEIKLIDQKKEKLSQNFKTYNMKKKIKAIKKIKKYKSLKKKLKILHCRMKKNNIKRFYKKSKKDRQHDLDEILMDTSLEGKLLIIESFIHMLYVRYLSKNRKDTNNCLFNYVKNIYDSYSFNNQDVLQEISEIMSNITINRALEGNVLVDEIYDFIDSVDEMYEINSDA